MGNPGLKPSWNNSLRINYNGYNADRQQGMMLGVDATQTKNSISNRMVYDAKTGVSYFRPENISGNWDGRGMFMFNSAIGKQKLFNINTFTSVSYQNAVGYVSTKPNDLIVTEQTYEGYSKVFEQAASQRIRPKRLAWTKTSTSHTVQPGSMWACLANSTINMPVPRCSKMPTWTLGILLMAPMPMSTSTLG